VVDKTGTLTEGKPRVIERTVSDEHMRLVAALERASEHPLAAAIANESPDASGDVRDVKTLPGLGISGMVDGHHVAAGNARMFEGMHLEPGAIHVVIDYKPAGTIKVADPIKESTPHALDELRKHGIEIVMLTGDARANAEAVAKSLGITRVEAEVLPAEKEAVVRKLQSE